MTTAGIYQWRDLIPRVPAELAPVLGIIVETPDPMDFTERPTYGGGVKIQEGEWVYSVEIQNTRTGYKVRVNGVREAVPKFYGDGAGRRMVGDEVILQRRSRTVWEIVGEPSKPQDWVGLEPPPTYIRSGDFAYVLITPRLLSMVSGESESDFLRVSVTPEVVVIGTGDPDEGQLRFDGLTVNVVPNEDDAAEAQVYVHDPNDPWENYSETYTSSVGGGGSHSHTVTVTIPTVDLFRRARIKISNLIKTSKHALTGL